MVYVSFSSIILRPHRLNASIHILGRHVRDHEDVMDFLSKIFEKLRFDYRFLSKKLYTFGYYVEKLAKTKIYVAKIPYHPFLYEKCINFNDECSPVFLYIDDDVVFRHLYVVEEKLCGEDCRRYHITSLDYYGEEYVEISITFYEKTPCSPLFCVDDEEVKKLAEDKEIYIQPYHGANEETKKLINKALSLKQ